MIRWVFFIVFIFIIDVYAFQSIKTLTKRKIYYVFYWVFSIGVLFYLLYTLYTSNDQKGMTQPMMSAFGLITLSIAPKLIALIVLFGEDIVRIFKGVVRYFSSSNSKVFCKIEGSL